MSADAFRDEEAWGEKQAGEFHATGHTPHNRPVPRGDAICPRCGAVRVIHDLNGGRCPTERRKDDAA